MNERTIVAKATRIYEVNAELPVASGSGEHTTKQTFLVEATSQAAAWKHVAGKYVKDVSLAPPKRLAELMGKGSTKVEAAEEAS